MQPRFQLTFHFPQTQLSPEVASSCRRVAGTVARLSGEALLTLSLHLGGVNSFMPSPQTCLPTVLFCLGCHGYWRESPKWHHVMPRGGIKKKTKAIQQHHTRSLCSICASSFRWGDTLLGQPSRYQASDGHSHGCSLSVPPPLNLNLPGAGLC